MKTNNVINTTLGISPNDALYELRAFRPNFVDGAEVCRAAVLHPDDNLGLTSDLRYAVARRAAGTGSNSDFLASYPASSTAELRDFAAGSNPQDRKLAALARHTDLIAKMPSDASKTHLQDLLDAGFSVPQIVALSELLAQVCYEMRIVHGLSLLKDTDHA